MSVGILVVAHRQCTDSSDPTVAESCRAACGIKAMHELISLRDSRWGNSKLRDFGPCRCFDFSIFRCFDWLPIADLRFSSFHLGCMFGGFPSHSLDVRLSSIDIRLISDLLSIADLRFSSFDLGCMFGGFPLHILGGSINTRWISHWFSIGDRYRIYDFRVSITGALLVGFRCISFGRSTQAL